MSPPAAEGAADAHGHHELRTAFARLWDLILVERESVWIIIVYSAFIGVVSLAAPVATQAFVSVIAFGGIQQPLIALSLLTLLALTFAALLQGLQWAVAERIQQRIFARTAIEVAQRLPHLMLSGSGPSGPAAVNRFLDVVTLQKGAASLLLDGIQVLLGATMGSLLLAFYHYSLAVFAIVLIVAVAVVLLSQTRRGSETAIEESLAKYEVVGWFEELVRNPVAFRTAHGERWAVERAERLTRVYLSARRAHFRVLFRQIVGFLAVEVLAMTALLLVGGFLVLAGDITLGQLIAAELIVASVTGAIARLGKYLEGFYDLVAAIDKVGHLLDLPVERIGGLALPEDLEDEVPLVTMVDASVRAENGQVVLSAGDLEIGTRDRVAILGPNGAGKSTLLGVLWGLEGLTAGRLDVEGLPIRDLDLRSLRSQVALVRGPEVVQGTVLENLVAGNEHMDPLAVRRALELVELWDVVAALPEGLSTPVARCGFSLGQLCRLLLARALAGKPKLVLIDGALDGLDGPSRAAIAQGVFGADAPWAVVVATSNPSVARLASRIYELSDGQLRRNTGNPSLGVSS